MRKNNQYNPLSQIEHDQLWKEIDEHEKLMPYKPENLANWTREMFTEYRSWSTKAHELRRLFDMH